MKRRKSGRILGNILPKNLTFFGKYAIIFIEKNNRGGNRMDDFDMIQCEEVFEDCWSDEEMFDIEEGIEF